MSRLGIGERLHLRAFIETVEVPIISATVSASVGAPAEASLEIAPTDTALRFLPRTMVHLFYFDAKEATFDPKSNLDEHYKLLFCGEVFTVSYGKSGPGSRSVTLDCMDFSNIWDTTYIYQLRYQVSGSDAQRSVYAGNQAAFFGAEDLADDIINDPAEVIFRYATDKSPDTPSISGVSDILGSLLSILELVGGVHGKTVGLYDMQTVTERRVRLLDQIASDTGTTAKQLYEQGKFEDWLIERAGNFGDTISFRELLGLVCSYTYYDVVPLPVARYVHGKRTVPVHAAVASSSVDDAKIEDLAAAFQPVVRAILAEMEVSFGWGRSEAKPPAVISSGARSAAHNAQIGGAVGSKHTLGLAADFSPAGYGVGFYYKARALGSVEAWRSSSGTLFQLALTLYALDPAVSKASLITGMNSAAVGYGDRFALWVQFCTELEAATAIVQSKLGVELRSGATFTGSDQPDEVRGVLRLWDLGADPVHVEMNDSRRDPAPTKPASSGPRQQLITEIFRPDVWFVAAPACNVIFPEEYTSFRFHRPMMREVTRLKLETVNTIVSDQPMFWRPFVAPQFAAGTQQNFDVNNPTPITFPHEKFSGIIPKAERMSEVAFYAELAKSEGTAGKTAAEATTSEEAASGKVNGEAYRGEEDDPFLRYASRAAAFHFLSYRYASRSMSVNCPFMPRIVVGFPAVIVDHEPSQELVGLRPIHFLGMVTRITHSLTQGGGTTSIEMSHARSHRTHANEIDDLFSQTTYAQDVVLSAQLKPRTSTVDVTAYTAAEKPVIDWVLGQVRAQERAAAQAQVVEELDTEAVLRGESTTVRQESAVPRSSFGAAEIGTTIIPGPQGGRVTRVEMQGPAASVQAGGVSYATPDAQAAAEAVAPRLPGSRLVVEEENLTPSPLEEALRPPWFSDEYSNANIGKKIYGPILGTDSILGVTGKDSVEEAVDAIVHAYGRARGTIGTSVFGDSSGHSVPEFVWPRTLREFASLPDVLTRGPGEDLPAAFHFYAGGNYQNLEHLDLVNVKNEAGQPIQLTTPLDNAAASISPELDPRHARWEIAYKYASELLRHKAFRG